MIITIITMVVALFARAWIEIVLECANRQSYPVALFARAWIEIAMEHNLISGLITSPSLRGRGLKYDMGFGGSYENTCRPLCEGVD